MKKLLLVAALTGALAMVGCNVQQATNSPPPPVELTASAIGHYCGMNVLEHSGPKGQILLSSRKDPVWFSSARDALSFTILPEEPKDISAIYVSDMAKATSWHEPGTTNWIDAKRASFVIGSLKKGGMGAEEAVPFGQREAAERFAQENGGQVVAFTEVPRDYVLGASRGFTSSEEEIRPEEAQHVKQPPGGTSTGHTHHAH
jgi:copper chaperone NosL